MSFSLNRFLRPLADSDKVIRIYNDMNAPVHIINPFSVLRIFISNLNINIALAGNKIITLDFKSIEETRSGLSKLQSYIDQLRNKYPQVIDQQTEKYVESVIQRSPGIISLNGSTASAQSIVANSDSNVNLNLSTIGKTHSVSISWSGLLPMDRGGLNNNNFTQNELIISATNSIESSGYKIDDDGISETDLWSAKKIIEYYNQNIISREVPIGVVDGVNLVFTLSNELVEKSEHVYLNGLLQDEGEDYNITGRTITFIEAPYTGSRIICSYISSVILQ
jgi:hypothetical protein